MHPISRAASAAFSMVILAGSSVPVWGADSPDPSSAPDASATPAPMASDWGAMEPGTYVTGEPFLARITFTLPAMSAAWEGNIGGPYAVWLSTAHADLLRFQVFDAVYAHPCQNDGVLLDPQPGPTVEDLAAVLMSLPGLEVTAPTDVTLGGYQGKELTLTTPATGTAACRVWILPLGATNDMAPGESQRVWILDVDGQRLVIDAPEAADLTAQTKAAVQAVLDSIRIEPVPATPAPSASPSPVAP
jgi:hypothetical protein